MMMLRSRRKIIIGIVYISCLLVASLAYHGEEMQTNKGPLLENVESKPFVPEDNDLHQSDILSPDQVLNDSEVLEPLEMQEDDQFFLHAFNLNNFIDVTSDSKMRHDLESSIMKIFLNESRYQINNDEQARVILNLTITYAGVGFADRPGSFSKLFAITLKLRSCQASTLDHCTIEKCYLKLKKDEKEDDISSSQLSQTPSNATNLDEEDHDNEGNHHYDKIHKANNQLKLLSKTCHLAEMRCAKCSSTEECKNNLQVPSSDEVEFDGNSNSGHCKVIPDDLRIDEHPSCYLSFVQVAGDIDVVRRGCMVQSVATPVMGQDILEEELNLNPLTKYTLNNFTCQYEIDNDYFTSCICSSNFCNHPNIPIPTISKPQIADPMYKQVLDEVNRSIRQLRSDIKQSLSEKIEKAIKCHS